MATDASIRDAVKLWNQKARERDSDAEKMEVKRIDTAQATLKLEYIDEGRPHDARGALRGEGPHPTPARA
jgi:hypothetical protein